MCSLRLDGRPSDGKDRQSEVETKYLGNTGPHWRDAQALGPGRSCDSCVSEKVLSFTRSSSRLALRLWLIASSRRRREPNFVHDEAHQRSFLFVHDLYLFVSGGSSITCKCFAPLAIISDHAVTDVRLQSGWVHSDRGLGRV